MPVEVEPPHQPIGNRRAYVDLGVKVPVMVSVDGEVFGYRANSLLSDWWYWTKRIAEHQSMLKASNEHTSQQLRTLYRRRRRRFRDRVNGLVSDFSQMLAGRCLGDCLRRFERGKETSKLLQKVKLPDTQLLVPRVRVKKNQRKSRGIRNQSNNG
ncbi:MAG: transposase [Candidatus Jordarchaeum sp.]|uniref:transposase n=1 Tax=Candidatus Jordarchaeum sp. TaxID=2823881 RepID=UPI0040499345